MNLIVWLAMLWSVVMYVVVMQLAHPAEPADNAELVTALLIAGFALVATSFLVKSRFFTRARESGKPGLRRVGHLLALAFCEAAALMGVAAWFVTGSPRCYYLLIVGFVGVLLHYPTRDAEVGPS